MNVRIAMQLSNTAHTNHNSEYVRWKFLSNVLYMIWLSRGHNSPHRVHLENRFGNLIWAIQIRDEVINYRSQLRRKPTPNISKGHVRGADWAHHDDVIKWKHFPRYWPFVRGIHRSPVSSPHEGQWRRALMFSLICVWINRWVNNRPCWVNNRPCWAESQW